MKIKTGLAACVLAASAFCGAAASAGQISYVNIDDAMVNSPATNIMLQEDGGAVKYNLYAGDSLQSASSDSFSISAPVYSFYKSHIITNTPSKFEASGKHLITVYEVKFKAELLDPTVEYKPKINFGLRYGIGDTAGFVENQQESSHIDTDGEWITLRYEFNPVTCKVKQYKNGELVREMDDNELAGSDFTEFRFYPRTIPEKNGDGLYPGGRKTLNFGDDDGKVDCCTPVIWTYDYIKIYQITPFEIASSQPAEGEENVNINGPFRISFDTDMTGYTLNPSTVQMELVYDGMTIPAMANEISADTYEITPFGMLEYYSRYRLKLLEGVSDINGLNGGKERYVSFITQKRDIKEDVTVGDVKIEIDQKTVSALANGILGGSYDIESVGEEEVKICTAVYSRVGDAVLCSARAEADATLNAGANTLQIPQVTISNAGNCYVKVMLWRAGGYPLADAVVCDSEGIRAE